MEAMNDGSLDALLPDCRQGMEAPPEALGYSSKSESVFSDDSELCLSLPESVCYELSGIGRQAVVIVPELEALLALSQDVFLERLYARLSSDGLKLCEKVSLCLNTDGELVISNPDERNSALERSLAQDETLALFFAEIAWRSDVLRKLKQLCNLVAVGSVRADQRAQWVGGRADEKQNVYQVTIKGEMSHFYFR